MKIFANILPLISIYQAVRTLNAYKKEIDRAKAAGDDAREQEYILKATDKWGREIVRRFAINLVIKGEENIPAEGPVLYVANHQGYGDIPVCAAALNKIQFAFIAKEDLMRIPVFGKWIERIRSISLDRGDARASLKAIEEAILLIKRGYSMLIFPEGTRSKGGPVQEFKRGSLRLATKPGIPVVPITIDGTFRIYEETGRVRKGQTVILTIHPMIKTAGMEKSRQSELAAEVEKIVKSGLEQEA